MKRVFLMLISAMLIGLTANAQNATKARQVLDKAAAKVGNPSGAKADFKMVSGSTTTAGTIVIKGNKFRATTPEAILWYDGTTQWTYMKNTDEVNISNPTEAQQAKMNPYKFITLYKSGYTLGVKTVGRNYEVHLTAQGASRSIQEMYITIGMSTYLPSKVKMLQGGKWYNITISNFSATAQSDATFKFNPRDYPDAEVIDLR